MTKPFHSSQPLAAAIAVAFIAAPAQAQQAADDKQPADAQAQKPTLETINVNAERVTGFRAKTSQVGMFRDAELIDVPMTINVVPRTVLDAQQAQGLYDALKNTAGVARSQTNGVVADNLSIRGVQTENRTSFRLNGGLPVNNLVEMPMEDKERVEVLKGSSALYYGFTSPAGVVNMVTKRAKAEPITSITLSGNEFGQFLGHLDVGRQFGANNQAGLRVNVAGGRSRAAIEGFDGRRQLVATAFDWRITDELSIQVDTENIQRTGIEQASVGLPPAVNNAILVPSVPDPTKFLSGKWAWTAGKIDNIQYRADYNINTNWALMVESGRAETDRLRRESSILNFANNAQVISGAGTLRVSLTRNQIYLNNNDRAEAYGRFQTWILDHEITFGYMQNKRFQNGPSQQVVNLPQNLFNPVELAEPQLTANITYSTQDITDRGRYVFDRVKLGEMWQLIGGVRHTDYVNNSLATGIYAVKSNTPSYALLFKPRPDTSLYASYIEGLEEGGTAPLAAANGGQVLPAGKSKQKEAGVRTDWIPGVSLTAAYFTINRASAYTNAANVFVLDGRTEYKGWEYSASGDIGQHWSLYFSGMFLDAKQQNAQNTALIGKTPDNTPDQTHSFFVEYRPGFVPGLGVNAGAYYISKRFVNALEQGSIPGYTIFNAGAHYTTRLHRHNVTFNLVVENALDKHYWSAAGGGFLAVGMPRTTKFSVKFDL